MKELLELIVTKTLPEGVDFEISMSEDEYGITYELSIPEEYRGKIIGRSGRNIKAIRDVLSIIARRDERKVFLNIAD